MPRFTVISSSPMVTIEAFEAATHAAFARVIDRVRGTLRIDSDLCAVITNASNRPIEALVQRWRSTIDGELKSRNHTSDGFFNPPYRPILLPGERLLATPGTNLPEDLPERFAMVSSDSGYVGDASHVHLEIDSVVLDDGSVSGVDRFGIALDLQGRQSVIADLITQCERALASGRSVHEAAEAFEQVYRDDRVRGRWAMRFARQLQRNDQFLAFLKRARPLPPNFGRRA